MSVAKVPLKGSQPDIRVSAGGIQPLCQTPMVGRTDAFVQHLLQRYTHSALPWSYPDWVFRHFLPGMTWSPIYYQPQLQLVPHLSFTVLRNETFQTTPVLPLPMPATLTVIRDKDVVRSTPMQSAPFIPVTLTVVHGKDATQSTPMQPAPFIPVTLTVVHGKDATQSTPMQPAPFIPVTLKDSASRPVISKIQSIVEERFVRQTLRQTLQQKDLVQQLVKQTKRVEAGMGKPTETLEVLSPAFQPANRVVRRTGAVLVESEVTPPTPEPSWMAPRGFPGISQGQTVGGTNAVDVNRLTDQVIQAIDRRMIAYRERSGRS